MEDHGRDLRDSLMYASPVLTPALLTSVERRVLELEKRSSAQEELIGALARGFMGLVGVCGEQQTAIEQLTAKLKTINVHLEGMGNALASHGKVLAMVERDYADDDTDAAAFDEFLAYVLNPPRRPR